MSRFSEKGWCDSGSAGHDHSGEAEILPVPQHGDIRGFNGFSSGEWSAIYSLQWWYQHGGSDRAPVLYHLTFLKWLVSQGLLEP